MYIGNPYNNAIIVVLDCKIKIYMRLKITDYAL